MHQSANRAIVASFTWVSGAESNALCCHLAAGVISKGCSAYRAISPNVEKEESALKEDVGMQDVQYDEVRLDSCWQGRPRICRNVLNNF